MLKVNLEKISLEEFVKKYGLRKCPYNEQEYFYRRYFDGFPIDQRNMISNGDVIKEENKNDA
jgi:hypothetical protein